MVIGRRKIFRFQRQALFFYSVKSKLIFPASLNQRFFGRLGFRKISLNLTSIYKSWNPDFSDDSGLRPSPE
jgi:hypothetical protein